MEPEKKVIESKIFYKLSLPQKRSENGNSLSSNNHQLANMLSTMEAVSVGK